MTKPQYDRVPASHTRRQCDVEEAGGVGLARAFRNVVGNGNLDICNRDLLAGVTAVHRHRSVQYERLAMSQLNDDHGRDA